MTATGLVLASTSLVAMAQTAPPPTSPPNACAGPAPPPPCLAPAPPVVVEEPEPKPTGGLLERLFGASETDVPIDHYDVGYDTGSWSAATRKLRGFFIELFDTATRWVLAASVWLIRFALSFGIGRALAAPAGALADAYRSRLVEPLALDTWWWLLAVGVAGWHALRGRLARGAADFALGLVIAAAAAIAFVNPGRALLGDEGALGRTRDLSLEVAAIGTGVEAAGDPVRPLTAGLMAGMGARPHQLKNWGEVIEGPGGTGRCAGTYRALVRSGPHGTTDEPRDAMRDAGCADLAEFNADPSWDRVGATVVLTLAAVVVCFLAAAIALAMVKAQCDLAARVITAPFVLGAAVAPGPGREVFFGWLAGIGRALVAIVVSTLLLVGFLVGLAALLDATAGQGLAAQMGGILGLSAYGLAKRRQLVSAGRRAVSRAGARLASMGPGREGQRWIQPAAAGVGGGFVGAMAWNEIRHRRRARRFTHAGGPSSSGLGGTAAGLAGEGVARPRGGRLAAAGVMALTGVAPAAAPKAALAARRKAKADTAALRERLARAGARVEEARRR